MPIGEGWDLPPDAAPWSSFHWFAVPVTGSLQLTVLSERPMWYVGHFHEQRMVPCPGQGCEACACGVGRQIRYTFAVADWETRRSGLLEVGQQNGLLIQSWCARNGGLRGMMLDLSKAGRQRQSRTVVRYVEQEAPAWAMGLDVPEVGLALYLTWQKSGCRVPEELRAAYEGKAKAGGSEQGGRSRSPRSRAGLDSVPARPHRG